MKSFFENLSIRNTILLTLILRIILPALFSTYTLYVKAKKDTDKDIKSRLQSYSYSYAHALWYVSDDWLATITSDLFRNKEIAAVKIMDKSNTKTVFDSSRVVKDRETIYFSEEIIYDKEKLGILHIYYYKDQIELLHRVQILTISKVVAIQALLSIMMMSILLYHKLKKRVDKLLENANRLHAGELDAPFVWSGNDELGVIGCAFEKARSAISEYVHEVESANEKLKGVLSEVEIAKQEALDMNDELEASNEQLIRLNRELDSALSELTQTQRSLIESEKMAALGYLVVGLSHELNTPIGTCVTAVSSLSHKLSEINIKLGSKNFNVEEIIAQNNSNVEMGKIILSNLNKASELLKNFKYAMGEEAVDELKKIDLTQYLNEIAMTLRHQCGTHSFEIESQNRIVVDTYPSAIAKIVLNLVKNSLLHGFEGIENGQMRLSVSLQDGVLKFIYSDNGRGIDTAQLSRIYEPFFTTKLGTGGSGLGMSTVYNLVTQKLKGTITVKSEPSKGVEFAIIVPSRPADISHP